MPLIFKYFWFIGAAVMLANVLMWRRRLAPAVERGRATRAEVDRFVAWLMVWLVGAPLALAIVSLAAGWPSPFCAGALAFDTIPRAVLAVANLGMCGSLLWWVWRGTGTDFLSRVLPALAQRPSYEKTYSPRVVRGVATALVVVSSTAAIAAMNGFAAPTAPNCPVAHP